MQRHNAASPRLRVDGQRDRVSRDRVRRSILAVVDSSPVGDGVGYVGLLLHRALEDIFRLPPHVLALDAPAPGRVGRVQALRFVARLTAAQLWTRPLVTVYNHIGIARSARWVPWLLRTPYAVFLHGIEAWDPDVAGARMDVVRHAAVRLSNSRFTAERVTQVHGHLGPIDVCPLALLPGIPETSDADLVAARHILGPRKPRVVIVGRMSALEKYKGHDELLESWPQVQQRIADAQLIIIGRGDDVDRLRAKAATAGVAASVHFTGYIGDPVMRAMLAESDVFALPSRNEGFGLVYLEAMRARLPCIGSTADAAVDVIEDGRTGLLVPQQDKGALANSIVQLLSDSTLRKTMGAAGALRERNVFSFGNFRDRVAVALTGRRRGLGTAGLGEPAA